MRVTRRDFLKIGGGAAVAGASWPLLTTLAGTPSPTASLPAAAQTVGEERLVRTICSLCPSGCGLEVRVVAGRAVKVEGNPLHPLNQGVCCPKGQASLEVLYSPERLPGPLRRKAAVGQAVPKPAATDRSQWEAISWPEAIQTVADRLRSLRDQGQAQTVAVLHGELRGQLRPLVERFLAAYGSPNVIASSSLDDEAARLALFLSQGINGYPVYDIDNSRYVLCFGGSLLESSRYLQKYLSGYGYMHRGRTDRGKLVVVDSRLNVTAAKADEWIPIRPGTLGALALGIAHVLIKSNLIDQKFVENWCFGYEDFKDDQGRTHLGFKRLVLEQYPLDRVADITGIASGTIARLAGEFGANRPALAILPSGRGDLTAGNGLYTALAIHALNALVGAIEVPGGVQVQHYPKLAPWPALPADAVAEKGLAHPRLDGAGSDYPVSFSAYQALADNLLAGRPYPANVIFLLNTNPVHEAPQGQRFAEALKRTPLVVSFSPTLDESAAYADLILPALTFLEVWQDDILEGTGYPGIGLRQPVVSPVCDGRNPGDVFLQLARAIGGTVSQAMPWGNFLDVIQQRISGMDISWDDLVEKGAWSALVYFFAAPGSKAWGQVVGRDRLHAPQDGRFDLFSRELFAALGPGNDPACLPHFERPAESADEQYPFLLMVQETMTQAWGWNGVIPALDEIYGLQVGERWESWVEIHPKAARALGIETGDWVWVESAAGKVRVKARLVEGVWPNAVNIPYGRGHYSPVQWGREGSTVRRTTGVNPYQLVAAGTEPVSGLAACLPTRVKVYKALS